MCTDLHIYIPVYLWTYIYIYIWMNMHILKIICVDMFSAYIYVCQVLPEAQRWFQFPWNWFVHGFGIQYRYWQSKLGLLKEQPMILTIEAYLNHILFLTFQKRCLFWLPLKWKWGEYTNNVYENVDFSYIFTRLKLVT